ncbi:hypothetical protein [Glaciihabitans sp. INWT7]|uniref:hypothetical protein n=1 Tax=Glaciihabitans sp. INWT7 TaxID=2596912 RepID=UPI0016283897|nr:hypothetical protein [Glaciihabitans sp. INWT7]
MYSSFLFPVVGIVVYLLGAAVIALGLFWVVRLGVRYALRDHDRWRESRSPNPPPPVA